MLEEGCHDVGHNHGGAEIEQCRLRFLGEVEGDAGDDEAEVVADEGGVEVVAGGFLLAIWLLCQS